MGQSHDGSEPTQEAVPTPNTPGSPSMDTTTNTSHSLPPERPADPSGNPPQPGADGPSVVAAATSQGAHWVWRAPHPDLPYPRPEWDLDGISISHQLEDGGRMIAASVRGRGHKQDALYCDDAHAFVAVGAWRVLIVSDGAGSALFSRVGAQLACEAARKRLARELGTVDLSGHTLREEDLEGLTKDPTADKVLDHACRALDSAFKDAREAIAGWIAEQNADGGESAARDWINQRFSGSAQSDRRPPESGCASLRVLEGDCSCTLLVVAYGAVRLEKADGSTPQMGVALSCSVGDGMMVVFRRPSAPKKENDVLPLMSPDTGTYAGQTLFIDQVTTTEESLKRRRRLAFVGATSDVLAVAAMTDGVADDYYDGRSGMRRLYCDLVLNGVLAAVEGPPLAEPIAEAQALGRSVVQQAVLELIQNDTAPRVVPVKYAGRYIEATGRSVEQLLDTPGLLREMADAEPRIGPLNDTADAQAKRLREWLDVYFVRGSFDDRTLVLFQPPTEPPVKEHS